MNLISNTAVMLCICTVACILVKFLVPEGVTRKTLNLIISTVLVITMIMPIKSLFTENNKININKYKNVTRYSKHKIWRFTIHRRRI